jgi:outer membrane protein OmpA-like peptidoglycan-associated protein
MKNKNIFFFLLISYFVSAQNDKQELDSLSIIKTSIWGDYFFVNGNDEKSIAYYSEVTGHLTLEQRRAFSKVLYTRNQIALAAKVMKPIIESNQAIVKDYYFYAQLIPDNQKLAKEYISKANRLILEIEYNNEDLTNGAEASPYTLKNLNINTEKSNFGATYLSQDNGAFFYLGPQKKLPKKRLRKKFESISQLYNIYKADLQLDSFLVENSRELNLNLNSVFQDGPLAINPKTNTLYLSRSSLKIDSKKKMQLDLYNVKINEIESQEPRYSSINLKGFSTLHPSVAKDGKRLYFASDRPGGFGGMDLYYVAIENDVLLGDPVNLGPDINTSANEVFPFSYSNQILFYSSDKQKDKKLAIYLASNLIANRWETRKLNPPFNSNEDDFSFSIENKVKIGFISSNRLKGRGEDDIYGFQFTPNVEGKSDVYRFPKGDTLIVAFNNILKNDFDFMKSKDPLIEIVPLQVKLIDSVSHGDLILNSNGSFLYTHKAKKPKEDSFSYMIDTPFGNSKNIKVELIPEQISISEYSEEVFRPIYYTFNRFDLEKKYKDRLDAIVDYLNENTEVEVTVSSYADCRGPRDYNLELTEKRSKTIVKYIGSRIHNPKRINGKGYGEDTIQGNDIYDYSIIINSFINETSAIKFLKKFNSLGNKAEITEVSSSFRIIFRKYDSYQEAEKVIDILKKLGYDGWISKRECYLLSEKDHQSKRKTTFKISN